LWLTWKAFVVVMSLSNHIPLPMSTLCRKTLGAPKAARAQPPSFVRVTFPVADNRRRDADNPAPTCKAIVDGLVDAGLWPDDSPEWVETLGSRFAKGAGVVVVEIIPRGELAA
jgi:Holliday junction resolvase RusA-like endonuclease